MVKLLTRASDSLQWQFLMSLANRSSQIPDIMGELGELILIRAPASLIESAHTAGQANDSNSASG